MLDLRVRRFQFAGAPTATAFNSSVGIDRWYGTALVPATLLNSSGEGEGEGEGSPGLLRCVSPSAEDAGLTRSLSLSRQTLVNGSLPHGVRLFGDASLAGEASSS